MNLLVNLTKRVMTTEGLRYCSVVESANGRIKPDWVSVDGKEERHPEGAYYIEWRDDGSGSACLSARTLLKPEDFASRPN
jgi:hypothetical protein